MKRRTRVAFTALAITVTAGLSVWLALSYASVRSGVPLGSTTKDQQSEIRELPLFDGAMLIEVNDDDPGDYSSIHYEVDAEVAAAENFYKGELPRLGWQLDALYHNRPGGDSVNLDWRALKLDDTVQMHSFKLNESDNKPYDLSLTLFIEDNRKASGAVGRTRVALILGRVPIVDRVPLPPNAAVTGIRDEMVGTYQNLSQIREHITTFTTNLNPDDVGAYYRDTLEQHGWVLIGPTLEPITDKQIPGSLHFTWWQGGIETGVLSASVGVIIKSQSDHQTVVELRTSGETGLR